MRKGEVRIQRLRRIACTALWDHTPSQKPAFSRRTRRLERGFYAKSIVIAGTGPAMPIFCFQFPAGRVKTKRHHLPSSLSAWICPPERLMRILQICNPRPLPRVFMPRERSSL